MARRDWIFSYIVVMTIKHKYLFIIGSLHECTNRLINSRMSNYIINITNKQHRGWYYSDKSNGVTVSKNRQTDGKYTPC